MTVLFPCSFNRGDLHWLPGNLQSLPCAHPNSPPWTQGLPGSGSGQALLPLYVLLLPHLSRCPKGELSLGFEFAPGFLPVTLFSPLPMEHSLSTRLHQLKFSSLIGHHFLCEVLPVPPLQTLSSSLVKPLSHVLPSCPLAVCIIVLMDLSPFKEHVCPSRSLHFPSESPRHLTHSRCSVNIYQMNEWLELRSFHPVSTGLSSLTQVHGLKAQGDRWQREEVTSLWFSCRLCQE